MNVGDRVIVLEPFEATYPGVYQVVDAIPADTPTFELASVGDSGEYQSIGAFDVKYLEVL